jgi:hypothetical protein
VSPAARFQLQRTTDINDETAIPGADRALKTESESSESSNNGLFDSHYSDMTRYISLSRKCSLERR